MFSLWPLSLSHVMTHTRAYDHHFDFFGFGAVATFLDLSHTSPQSVLRCALVLSQVLI